MIKNLVFDLGGVIIPLNRIACIRAFDKVVGYKHFGEILSAYRQEGFFDRFERGLISSMEFREAIKKGISYNEDGSPRYVSDDRIDYSLNCFLSDIPARRIYTLLHFKKDYRLFLLSNTNPIGMARARELFRDHGCECSSIFEKEYLSYELKCAKPDDLIFEKMLEDSGINPDETLYIDDYPANVKAGEKFGLHSILFNPKEDDLYEKIHNALERK